MSKISMKNIADKVGVSKCTVSLVLSGKAKEKRISDSIIEKVLEVAKELNYEPNELARGLRTGQTKTIGVIVADISNEFFGELVYHIQRQAHSQGYSVIVTNSDESPTRMFEQINLLVNRQVDGIILVPTNNSISYAKSLVHRSIPLVQVDRFLPGLDASHVVLDNYEASREVVRKLLSKGACRTALVCHKDTALNGRVEGYIDACKEAGTFDPALVLEIDYSNEVRGIEAAIDDLFGGSRKADSIFFYSHELFLLGIQCIHRKDRSILDDVKVACFDKITAFALVDFPLIYVEQPIASLGQEAVDVLLGHIGGSKEIVRKALDARIEELPRAEEGGEDFA